MRHIPITKEFFQGLRLGTSSQFCSLISGSNALILLQGKKKAAVCSCLQVTAQRAPLSPEEQILSRGSECLGGGAGVCFAAPSHPHGPVPSPERVVQVEEAPWRCQGVLEAQCFVSISNDTFCGLSLWPRAAELWAGITVPSAPSVPSVPGTLSWRWNPNSGCLSGSCCPSGVSLAMGYLSF